MNPQPRERFAENLQAARWKAGLTQEEIAKRCKLHRSEVSLLERGLREPRLGTLVKLSSAIGVGVEELSQGITWNEHKQRFEIDG